LVEAMSAIEPIIGHMKNVHSMNRNYLKGTEGNRVNAILAAVGYNLAKLLAWFYCALRKLPPQTRQNRQETVLQTTLNVLFV